MRAPPLAFPVALALALAPVLLRARVADAQETPHHVSLLDRAHTIAELEGGIIALPTAPISASNRGGATPLGTVGNGDATVQTGVHVLYRPNREWAFGAGAMFAPNPTSDPNYGGASFLPRTHSRSYLFLGGEARYFAFRWHWFEGWIGMTAGALIIADRFTTNPGPAVPAVPPLLGTTTVTVSTEGFAVGIQAGADYAITDQLELGLALRADRWLLPTQKPFSQESSCDALGDCPTLTGSVAAFEFGLTLGYQIPL
jgi:hypothetical protein